MSTIFWKKEKSKEILDSINRQLGRMKRSKDVLGLPDQIFVSSTWFRTMVKEAERVRMYNNDVRGSHERLTFLPVSKTNLPRWWASR
jgi:hypothetical protein